MKALLDLIPRGKQNATSCRELSRLSGIPERQIKAAVSRLRLGGAIICSSLDSTGGGYFLPGNLDELKEYVITEKKRIQTAAAALRAAEAEMKKRSQQGN